MKTRNSFHHAESDPLHREPSHPWSLEKRFTKPYTTATATQKSDTLTQPGNPRTLLLTALMIFVFCSRSSPCLCCCCLLLRSEPCVSIRHSVILRLGNVCLALKSVWGLACSLNFTITFSDLWTHEPCTEHQPQINVGSLCITFLFSSLVPTISRRTT